jgi:hypothetical protein
MNFANKFVRFPELGQGWVLQERKERVLTFHSYSHRLVQKDVLNLCMKANRTPDVMLISFKFPFLINIPYITPS